MEARQGRGRWPAAWTPCSTALAAGLRLVALAVYPVIPVTAVEVLRRIGQAHGDADLLLEKATWASLTPATVVVGPSLFPRLETAG